MIDFRVETSGIEEAMAAVKAVSPKELPFIMALALTETARDVEFILKRAMQSDIDRPRQFTINSLYATRATKAKQEAFVQWKMFAHKGQSGGHYLRPIAEGSSRPLKRSEGHLKRIGLLPNGYFLVPGQDADLDSNGNIKVGIYTKMLSSLSAHTEVGFSMNKAKKGSNIKNPWFVIQPGNSGGMAPGIYERLKSRRRLIFAIVKAPKYHVSFPFAGITRRAGLERMPIQFEKAIEKALTTGKYAIRD